ncbi:MAG TPA: nucleotidyltransferase domain-containing protein [Bacteroidales bacterium]|nr:nucleotidyltransferase domain-containing protein [Bacteroidales bacterium]
MFGLKSEQIAAIDQCFEKYPEIDLAIIYGSRAKNTYRYNSDIDLTLIGDLSFRQLLKLENELDDLLLPYKIDLSLKSTISNADLIEHIDRVGKIFYDKSRKINSAKVASGERVD